jgi:hypothetical protein
MPEGGAAPGPEAEPPNEGLGEAAPVDADCDFERDRQAIVGMAGVFDVSFVFDETDALTAGYVPKGRDQTAATELVEVIERGAQKVVLQHVLLFEGADGQMSSMKHWRQDWTFEDRRLLEFKGKGTFARRDLATADVQCTWSQAVFEVTDAPRYESFGKWAHTREASTWTSQETWRPLPRREYTKRNDYDVLVAVNRHVVTKDGWRHEQDNVKWVLDGQHGLVRETGLNDYVRTTKISADVARLYLKETEPFWSGVRSEWQAVFDRHATFALLAEVDGEPLYAFLFPLADDARRATGASQLQKARDWIRRFTDASRESIARK